MNKKGGFTDLFLFIIFAFVILFISGVMIFIGTTTYNELKESFKDMTFGGTVAPLNASENVDRTVGVVNNSYKALYWLSVVMIIGMALSIFVGSYMVTTRPVFLVPYIFIVIIAIVSSVFISNAYGELIADPTLADSFEGFVGANFIMGYLPIWVTVIGFVGGMIMFSRLGSKENQMYGGYYG